MQQIAATLLIPFAGTVAGAAFVFFIRRQVPGLLQKGLLGFASGVMVAASVWSLLIPSMDMSAGGTAWEELSPAVIGFAAGMAFLLLIDYATPHLHLGGKAEGPRTKMSRTAMLVLAVTIHNIPEGMAVGAVVAGALGGGGELAGAGVMAMALGIAIQNVPEGAVVSMPMLAEGNSRLRSFAIGALSGIVEPLSALAVIAAAAWFTPLLPYLLAFAAGAMLYVVVEELIPEASEGSHSNIGTVGFGAGFALMMPLDVVFA